MFYLTQAKIEALKSLIEINMIYCEFYKMDEIHDCNASANAIVNEWINKAAIGITQANTNPANTITEPQFKVLKNTIFVHLMAHKNSVKEDSGACNNFTNDITSQWLDKEKIEILQPIQFKITIN